MEAKDTVDYKKAWEAMNGKGKEDTAPIKLALECQAEISFKAGKIEGIRLYSGWLRERLVDGKGEELEAKLKEWGLDEK